MSDTTIGKTTAALILGVAVLILIFTDYGDKSKIYDCSIAEMHPDVPSKVKEECRKLQFENLHRQQQIEKKNITT